MRDHWACVDDFLLLCGKLRQFLEAVNPQNKQNLLAELKSMQNTYLANVHAQNCLVAQLSPKGRSLIPKGRSNPKRDLRILHEILPIARRLDFAHAQLKEFTRKVVEDSGFVWEG